MAGPVRTRLACDRCHSQKLRCPKEAGSSVCTRCLRAGVACLYSPPGRGPLAEPVAIPGRQPSHASGLAAVNGGEIPMAMDWSFLDQWNGGEVGHDTIREALFPTGVPLQDGVDQQSTGGRAAEPVASESERDLSSTAATENPAAECTHQLTAILLDMEGILGILPSKAALHISHDNALTENVSKLVNKTSSGKILEGVFASTQRLINLYPTAIRLLLCLDSEPSSECSTANCIHHIPLPEYLADIDLSLAAQGGPAEIDHGLANLLVACHLKVLDVLDGILLLAVCCFRVTAATPTVAEPDFAVPELRVGSFVPSRDAAVFMQTLLLKHLLDSLSERCAQLSKALGARLETHATRDGHVLVMQCELLSERTSAKIAHIKTLADNLQRFGILESQRVGFAP